MQLPSFSGNGIKFHLQVYGDNAQYIALIFGSNDYIYTGTDTFSLYGNIVENTTYLLTYFQTSGNVWAVNEPRYPSYTLQVLGSNNIPLKEGIDIFLFKTNNYHAITANVTLPANPNDSQLYRFKDISGQLATTKVQLNDFSIENETNYLLNTNYKSVLLMYDASNLNYSIL